MVALAGPPFDRNGEVAVHALLPAQTPSLSMRIPKVAAKALKAPGGMRIALHERRCQRRGHPQVTAEWRGEGWSQDRSTQLAGTIPASNATTDLDSLAFDRRSTYPDLNRTTAM